MSSEDAAASLRGPRSQGCRALEGGRRRRGREEAERGRIGEFGMQRHRVVLPFENFGRCSFESEALFGFSVTTITYNF